MLFADLDLNRLLELFVYNPKAPLIFNSGFFLWLFLGFMVVYVLLKKQDTPRILFVTLFSYYFYYKRTYHFDILMFSIVNI